MAVVLASPPVVMAPRTVETARMTEGWPQAENQNRRQGKVERRGSHIVGTSTNNLGLRKERRQD